MVRKLNLEEIGIKKMDLVKSNFEEQYNPIINTSTSIPEVDRKEKKQNLWDKIFKKEKLKNKPNRIAVTYLRLNGTAEPLYVDTDNKGMFQINKRTYHLREDCRYLLGKDRIPFFVVKEEGMIPQGNTEYYKNLDKIEITERRCAELQDSAIKAIRHAELVKISGEDKPKINKMWIIFIIIGIIAFALLKNYL